MQADKGKSSEPSEPRRQENGGEQKSHPKAVRSLSKRAKIKQGLISQCRIALIKLQTFQWASARMEDNVKALQVAVEKAKEITNNIGMTPLIIAEVLGMMEDRKCIVKLSCGTRAVVTHDQSVRTENLTKGRRVALDEASQIIMLCLPRVVDSSIHSMIDKAKTKIEFGMIGGLEEQIRSIREVVELPLLKPDLFKRIGIKAPKGILLYGPPGTGKTLLAKAVSNEVKCNFLRVCSSAVVDKYIGESARTIREIFSYAKSHAPCIIFFDEIDAIGVRRTAGVGSADREIQRCMIELLHQLDGFDTLQKVNVVMATNRPDILDPALLRPGRLDRKIEIPLPNVKGRHDILKIHTKKMGMEKDVRLREITDITVGLSGADLRCVCSEAGYNALREDRDQIDQDDLVYGAKLMISRKKLEGAMNYKPANQQK